LDGLVEALTAPTKQFAPHHVEGVLRNEEFESLAVKHQRVPLHHGALQRRHADEHKTDPVFPACRLLARRYRLR